MKKRHCVLIMLLIMWIGHLEHNSLEKIIVLRDADIAAYTSYENNIKECKIRVKTKDKQVVFTVHTTALKCDVYESSLQRFAKDFKGTDIIKVSDAMMYVLPTPHMAAGFPVEVIK